MCDSKLYSKVRESGLQTYMTSTLHLCQVLSKKIQEIEFFLLIENCVMDGEAGLGDAWLIHECLDYLVGRNVMSLLMDLIKDHC